MKVDLFKVDEIRIQDKDGKVIDRFYIDSASLIKDKISGKILILRKGHEKDNKH